jgi:uncharacterized protein YndB with AHSA1/START domain
MNAMARYGLVTNWHFEAPIDEVWQALSATDRYHEWWPSIVESRNLTPGVTGVGATSERVIRGRLPYRLRYRTTVTYVDPLRELGFVAEGDLSGNGKFVFSDSPRGTRVLFHWNVQATRWWMRLLSPVLRPVFAWNQRQAMAEGEQGLARWLEQEQAACD